MDSAKEEVKISGKRKRSTDEEMSDVKGVDGATEKILKRDSEELNFNKLFNRALDFIKPQLNVKEEDIQNAITEIKKHFVKGDKSMMDSDFNKPKNLIAYFFRWSTLNACVARDRLLRAFNSCKELEKSIKKPTINVVSLGGGPGTDIIGLCSVLQGLMGNTNKTLNLTIVEKYSGWRYFDNIIQRLLRKNEQFIQKDEKLIRKDEQLICKNEQLILKYDKLIRKNEQLIWKNEQLIRKDEQIIRGIEQLIILENGQLKLENEQLKLENVQLKLESEQLIRENDQLIWSYDKLMRKYDFGNNSALFQRNNIVSTFTTVDFDFGNKPPPEKYNVDLKNADIVLLVRVLDILKCCQDDILKNIVNQMKKNAFLLLIDSTIFKYNIALKEIYKSNLQDYELPDIDEMENSSSLACTSKAQIAVYVK